MKSILSFLLILTLLVMIFLSGCQRRQGVDDASNTLETSQATVSAQSHVVPSSQSAVSSESASLQAEISSAQSSSALQNPAHTHHYVSEITNATCTAKGYTTYTCACGKSYRGQETKALGHSFGNWTVKTEATASSPGVKERVCIRCSYQETEIIPKVEAPVETVESYASKVVEMVNLERRKNGLAPLQAVENLAEYALVRSRELPQVFDHKRPDGSNPLDVVLGYGYMAAGENIALGYRTPAAVMNGWMESEGHRENILHTGFKYIGVGCYLYNGTYYWTQIFGG